MNDHKLIVPDTRILFGGRFIGQHIRNGKIIDEWDDHNLITDEGINNLLDVYLRNQTNAGTWYIGLFEGNYTPLVTDTGATIAANADETTALTNTVRPTWTPAAAAAKAITNSASKATFTFNADTTIYGGFLISNNVIGGNTGKCFAASRFTSSKAVGNGDQILLTYAFAGASA